MSYNQYTTTESKGPSNMVIGGVATATTLLVAFATFTMTADNSASLYTAQGVRVAPQVRSVMPVMNRAAIQQPQAFAAPAGADAQGFEYSQPALNPLNLDTAAPAPASNNGLLLVASFSSMLLAVASAMAAAFGYRSETVAMANSGGKRTAAKGGGSKGGQAGVGYKGSTIPGSAPTTRDGKPGAVYKLGIKNGLGNVDEYSPIYVPGEWKSDGDTYEPGALGLAVWAAGFLSLLGVSGFLIYYTSAL